MTEVATTPTPAGPAVTLARTPPPPPGRLTTLALLGGAVGALPLPYLPTTLMRRIRGALAHDVAARHGVSLTEDARDTLAEPSAGSRPGALRMTAVFFARRALGRIGVFGLLPPLTSWFQVYAFGLLFERYFDRFRGSLSVRIHAPEAARVRSTIDRALGRVLSRDLSPAPLDESRKAAEDLRTVPTRVVDEVLLGVASLPSRLQHRLEAAFDDVWREERQTHTGPRPVPAPAQGAANEPHHV